MTIESLYTLNDMQTIKVFVLNIYYMFHVLYANILFYLDGRAVCIVLLLIF